MEALHRMNRVVIELFHKPTCIFNKLISVSTQTNLTVSDPYMSCAGLKGSSFIQPCHPVTEKNTKGIGSSILCRGLKSSKTLSNGRKRPVFLNRCYSTVQKQSCSDTSHLDVKDPKLWDILSQDMIVKANFLSDEEERSLLLEVDKHMRRLRYEFDHWDNAIHGYRETEKKAWSDDNMKILNRVKDLAFTSNVAPLAYVHVLDIAKEGYIKPHVDAVRFCGDTITGMCLLSSCVMRLALENDSTKYADIYLPRRSLYIMRGRARYDFTHEVLKDKHSYFKGQYVSRDRRISIICRNEPSESSNV